MANPSLHNHTELSLPCVAAEAATELGVSRVEAERASLHPSFSSLHSMQDIIEHEYALVESIPDEDRATLMPIIRFVRNTLQDPYTSPYTLPQAGCAMDAICMIERSRVLYGQGNKGEGFHFKGVETLPHTQAFAGNEEMRHRNINCLVDMHREGAYVPELEPWQRGSSTGAFRQHWSFQCPTSMCPTSATTRPSSDSMKASQCDYAAQFQEHGGFSFHSEQRLHDPHSLASPEFGDHESELSNILSGMDMESFHLEELRRSLRPSSNDMDSDVNDIDSVDVNNANNGYGGDDGDDDGEDDVDDDDIYDNMDGNDESLLAYPHYDGMLRASDAAWHSYWGNDLHYYPVPSAHTLLRFPKLHCRRRNVVKKVVGWVKKRATQSFVSRVRHKRRCNLPCCTDCEGGVKRRKVTGNGSKRCAKLSTIIKASPPSTVTDLEKRNNSDRQASDQKDGERDISAIYESLDGKEASQVTRDWANSPLMTALIILLMKSRSRGMTANEALHELVRQGYAEIIGCGSKAFAEHVKTTLTECPDFKELKNHRFVLRDRRQLDVTNGQPHFAPSPKRELSVSQEGCSQALTKTLGMSFSSRRLCQKPLQGQLPQCRKTDGKHWRCTRHAKLGFLYCERHQQSRGRNHGHFLPEKRRPCASDVDEEINAAKEEEMSETVVDSCSAQSIEHDTEEAEPIRCCRTDGKNWQCSNQAEESSLYCEHHQGRCKKEMVKGRRLHGPSSKSENTGKLREAETIKQTNCISGVSRFAMQLRPRHNTAATT